jgi:hypothetical protein
MRPLINDWLGEVARVDRIRIAIDAVSGTCRYDTHSMAKTLNGPVREDARDSVTCVEAVERCHGGTAR